VELCSDLCHPILDELHLLESKIKTQTIEALIGRQVFEQAFEPRNHRFDLIRLGFVDVRDVFGPVELGEVQASEKFEANRTSRPAESQFEPLKESPASRFCDVKHLARRQFLLLDDTRGNIAALFKPLKNGIRLTLTHMPDMTQLDGKALVQVIAVAGAGDQKSK